MKHELEMYMKKDLKNFSCSRAVQTIENRKISRLVQTIENRKISRLL